MTRFPASLLFLLLFLSTACQTTGENGEEAAPTKDEANAILRQAERLLRADDPLAQDMEKSLKGLERLTRSNPKSKPLRLGTRLASRLALRYRRLERPDAQERVATTGRSLAERWIEIDDEAGEAHYRLAELLGLQLEPQTLPAPSDAERLKKAGERAVELNPGFEGAAPLRLMGEFYLEAPEWLGLGDLGRALQLLKKAVELAPDHPETHFLLGWAYLEDGQTEKGKARLKKAADLAEKAEDAELLRRIRQTRETYGLPTG